MSAREVLPSVCPLDCPDRCSLEVTVEGDRVTTIDGSRTSPLTDGYICAKVRRFDRRLDSPERVLHPMRRTGPKGEGRFERISWDEATTTIAKQLRATLEEHGPESVLPFSYSGSNGLLTSHAMDERFWHRFGASQLARTFCAANTGAAWLRVLGDLPGSDPGEVERSDGIVLWGVNPSVTGIHLVPLVRRATAAGAALAVVDPRRTPLARGADLHLPALPGTDVALALATARLVLAAGAEDRSFLERHTRGLDAFRALVEPWTPQRAARIAGVEPAAIHAFAEILATARRPFFRVGWGLERNRNGSDAVAAVLALRLLLGKFEEPGAGLALSTSRGYGIDFARAERPDLRRGSARTINMSELGRALEETADPPITTLWVYNCNPVATAPNQSRVVRALGRESLFTIVHEQVWTDTCALADLVLPATTFLEHREISRSYGGYALQWAEPVVAPRGEARSNHRVFADVAAALGWTDPALRETEEDLARTVVEATPRAAVSFGDLRSTRFAALPPARPFVTATPSRGSAELPASLAYRPPPVDESLPLSLISPSSDHAISSTLFETLPAGSGRLQMAPADAGRRGLAEGDLARVRNSLGEVVVRVSLREEIPEGVCALAKGLWRRATENGWTANALAPDHVDERGAGACYNDARVEVERAGAAGTTGRP